MKIGLKAARLGSAIVATVVAAIFSAPATLPGQAPPPPDAPDVVDFAKLIPLLPEPPEGWAAEKAEGSTSDVGGFKLTTVHRDYKKGEGDNTPTASISVLDSAANQDYVTATTAAWKINSETSEVRDDRRKSRVRSVREGSKTRRALGHGRQTLFPGDRIAKPGSQGIAGLDQTCRSEEARGNQVKLGAILTESPEAVRAVRADQSLHT